MMLPPAYRPFLDPLPVADVWMVLILPLCLAVAIVWKAMKCRSLKDLWRESAIILLWILGGFFAVAMVLVVVVRWIST